MLSSEKQTEFKKIFRNNFFQKKFRKNIGILEILFFSECILFLKRVFFYFKIWLSADLSPHAVLRIATPQPVSDASF